tara:strand:- start:27279 stop:28202 length:924 start_codon:yes stop_codon:yes gene_type:complete
MRDFLAHASKQYYEGTPIISDAEFDILESQYGSENVGYTMTDGIKHYYPMYSLQKCFSLDDCPIPLDSCICSPKLDGAAVSVIYVAGSLALALTRGDGKVGRDITEKMSYLVPATITQSEAVVQITGEVVCPSSVENSRNVASGSLNLKDMEEFHSRPLTFVAYDAQGVDFDTYEDSLSSLASQGFDVVTKFNDDMFPTDGLVYRLNSYKEYKKLGYTAHHPRGAFALKQQKEGQITTLTDVVWQVGKSGVVSPVALLDAVDIDGATVRKATLHNIQYIQELNLEIGCQVEIIRSGDIIPRVVRRIA